MNPEKLEKRGWLVLTIVWLCAMVSAQDSRPAPATPLQAGQIVEREGKGGQTHAYQIPLNTGDFLQLEVEQRAIDLEVIIFSPAQQKLAGMDSNNGTTGPERVATIASQTGDYRIEVVSSDPAVPPGRYIIKVLQQRPATPEDRQWIKAQAAYLLGAQLRAQPVAESRRQAIPRFEEATSIWLNIGDRLMAAHALYYIASGHRNFGNRQEGLKTLLRAQEVLQAAGETRDDATLLTNLAVYSHNDGDAALSYYEQALQLWRKQGDSYGETRARTNLAIHWLVMEEREKALEQFQQILPFWQNLNNQRAIADTLFPMGQIYDAYGEWQKALEVYEQALAIFRSVKYYRGEGQTLIELGLIYQRLGVPTRWLDYTRQALELWRKLGDRVFLAGTLINLGSAESTAGDPQRAIEYFQEAIKLAQELKDRKAEALARRELGRHQARMRNYQDALQSYDQSLTISAVAGDHNREAITRLAVGESYHALQQFDEAAKYYAQALIIARENKNPDTESAILFRQAENEQRRGNLVLARTLIEESLHLEESLRASLISPDARTSYFAYTQHMYQLYIDLLMQQHKAEPAKEWQAQALEASERHRARGLLDLLVESRVDFRQSVDPALLERERTIARRLHEKARSNATTPESAAALKLELSRLEIELERAQDAIRKASPRYVSLTQPQPLTLQKIQQQLDEGESPCPAHSHSRRQHPERLSAQGFMPDQPKPRHDRHRRFAGSEHVKVGQGQQRAARQAGETEVRPESVDSRSRLGGVSPATGARRWCRA